MPQQDDFSKYEVPAPEQAAPPGDDFSKYEVSPPSQLAEDDIDKLLSTPVPIPPRPSLPSPLRYLSAFAKQTRDIYMASGGTQRVPPPPPEGWEAYYQAHKDELRNLFHPSGLKPNVSVSEGIKLRTQQFRQYLNSLSAKEVATRLVKPSYDEFAGFLKDFIAYQDWKEGKTPEAAGKLTANVGATIPFLLGLASLPGGRGIGGRAPVPGDLGPPTAILPPAGRPGAGVRPPGMAGVQPIAVGPLGRPTAPALARPPGLRVGPLTALARDYLGTTDFEAQKTVADAIDANLDAERIAAEKTGEALDLYGAGRMWAKAAHERQQDIAAQEKQQEQDAAITEAQEKNAKALQQYGRDTTDYRQQRAEILRQASREIITQNQEREAAYGPEPGKFSTMTNFTRGQAAQRVIPRLGDRLTRVLPQARADARAEGNRRFNQVRDQVANNPDGTPIQFPADDVPAGVNDALALLRGSRTNISIFNDLLDRFPEGEEPPEEEAPPVAPTGPTVPTPDQIALSAFGVTAARAAERIGLQAFNDFVANVQATPGRPVTPPSTGLFPAEPVTVPVPAPRRVADLITTQPATLTWNDMQGYVTELGYRINAARNTNAPQDVATAMQSLRSFLQQKMMQIAEARNQGGRLRDANNFWADHMQFWFNSSSPIARAIKLARAGINRQNPAAPNANRRAIADLVGRPVVQPFIQRLAEFGPNGLRANSLSLAIRRAQGIVKAGGNEPAPLAPTRERFAAAQAKIKLKRPTEPEPEKPTAVTPFRPTPFRPRPAPLPIRPQDVEGWQLIGPETILRANQARAKAGLQLLAHQGTWILPITAWTSTMAAISIIFPTHTLAQGLEHLGMSVLSIPAFLWSRSQIVSLLSSPRVLQLLTEPTPDQLRALDSVPDRFRSDAARSIRAVATVARQQGIPVNPKLINWANQLGQRRLPVIPDTRDRKRQELMRRGRELTATPMQQQQAPAADLRAPDLQPHIPASDQVFATIASREGFVPTAWLDTMATPHTDEEKRAGGIWTIGYGRTENVQPGETTSRAKEEEWTRVRAAELQDQILASLNPDVKLNEPQLVALIDFAYHKGIAAFRRSTLLKELNLGHMEKVADEINRWVISRGKVQPGLINRAQQESEPFIGAGVQ